MRAVEAVQRQEVISVIEKKEVNKALKKMKNGKAVGLQNIPIKAWRCLRGHGFKLLT